MTVVEGLVVAHLSATALLLLGFVLVVLCQRLTQAFQRTPQIAARPSDVPTAGAVPRQAVGPDDAPAASPSVLDWTIDLRDSREAAAPLQTS